MTAPNYWKMCPNFNDEACDRSFEAIYMIWFFFLFLLRGGISKLLIVYFMALDPDIFK